VAPFPFVISDVFTDRPLSGNQLGIFPHGGAVPEALLQPLARELNFSETVFVLAPQADGDARLRIFTPTSELRFAGHPVLGSAAFLAARDGRDELRLETGAGTIHLRLRAGAGRVVHGVMRQPVPSIRPFADPDRLLAALRLPASRLPIELYDNGMPHVYVVLESSDEVAAVRPDRDGLIAIALEGGMPSLGVNCSAVAGPGRARTRMFGPSEGVDEDPATGSAAGPLAVHLARHGLLGFGEPVTIAQGIEIGRPSTLLATVTGDRRQIEAVQVGGDAVVVARGEFDLDDFDPGESELGTPELGESGLLGDG
jgi:trans-2,3-dihydro-3-hydroxyanthranilate isomerase